MENKQLRRKRRIYAALLSSALLVLLVCPFSSSAIEGDSLMFPAGTPRFFEGTNNQGDNYNYSLFAYSQAFDEIYKYKANHLMGLSAYYTDGFSPGQPLFDLSSLSSYGVSTIPYGTTSNNVLVCHNPENVDGMLEPNVRFYYKVPRNDQLSTYLAVTRLIYDRVQVPEIDVYFKIEYMFDFFWNNNRVGASQLYSLMTEACKPMIRFTNDNQSWVAFAEPSEVLIGNYSNDGRRYERTWRVQAYFKLSTDELRALTPGVSFNWMEMIIPYPAMLPGTGNYDRVMTVDAWTQFPTIYTFLSHLDYTAELDLIADLIRNQTDYLYDVTEDYEDLIAGVGYGVGQFKDKVAQYGDEIDWVLTASGDIVYIEGGSLLPSETVTFANAFGEFANNTWIAPLIITGLSFAVIRLIFIGVG